MGQTMSAFRERIQHSRACRKASEHKIWLADVEFEEAAWNRRRVELSDAAAQFLRDHDERRGHRSTRARRRVGGRPNVLRKLPSAPRPTLRITQLLDRLADRQPMTTDEFADVTAYIQRVVASTKNPEFVDGLTPSERDAARLERAANRKFISIRHCTTHVSPEDEEHDPRSGERLKDPEEDDTRARAATDAKSRDDNDSWIDQQDLDPDIDSPRVVDERSDIFTIEDEVAHHLRCRLPDSSPDPRIEARADRDQNFVHVGFMNQDVYDDEHEYLLVLAQRAMSVLLTRKFHGRKLLAEYGVSIDEAGVHTLASMYRILARAEYLSSSNKERSFTTRTSHPVNGERRPVRRRRDRLDVPEPLQPHPGEHLEDHQFLRCSTLLFSCGKDHYLRATGRPINKWRKVLYEYCQTLTQLDTKGGETIRDHERRLLLLVRENRHGELRAKGWLTVVEAAKTLGCTPRRVRQLSQHGTLVTERTKQGTLIDPETLSRARAPERPGHHRRGRPQGSRRHPKVSNR